MSEDEIRTLCLELAVKTARTEESPDKVVDRAQAYYEFIKNSKADA